MPPLEEQLRQLFVAQAQTSRVVEDLAGRAIRRAKQVRRRRAAGSGLAAVAVVALFLGGVVALRGGVQPGAGEHFAGGPAAAPAAAATPAPTATPEILASVLTQQEVTPSPASQLRALGVDLRVDRELWSVAGKRFRLAGVGQVGRVYRVPLGWVYGGPQDVRLLRTDGTSVALGRLGTRWLVSPDGGRLALVQNRSLAVYTIGKRGLTLGATVPVPEEVQPVAFAGKQVVISSGGEAPFGALLPSGSDQPVWNKTVLSVYGAAGERVTGLVQDDRRGEVCLAALKAGQEGLVVTRSGACRSGQQADEVPRVLAPSGGWLAEPAGDETVLTELSSALDGKKASVPCPVASTVPPVWADDSTLLASDGRRIMRCRTDGAPPRSVPLPDGVGHDWEFVPRMLSKRG